MYEYDMLHPQQEEETELTSSAKDEIALEERIYAAYCSGRNDSSAGCTFEAKTTLSPMYFTRCTPGVCIQDDLTATTGTSLQIFFFKIVEIKGDLKDEVDFNCNILFNQTRNNAQEVTEDVYPFLRLIGPARAILPELEFEVELRVKGRTKIELSLEQLTNSVQATIMGVRIVKGGPWTFKYGGRVASSSPPHEVWVIDSQGTLLEVTDPPSIQVVLLDSRYCDSGEMPMGTDESHVYYPKKFEETFKVVIQAYSESGDVAAQGHVKLTPKLRNISQAVCDLCDSKVEITVAWSAHVESNIFL
ncbi:hypothetical protein VPH35_125551 [Triticum aestivum]